MQQIVKKPESIISWLTRVVCDAVQTLVFGNGHVEQYRPHITQDELDRREYDNVVLAGKLIEQEQEIARLKAINHELEQAALTDPLTRLFNRRGAEAELDRVLAPFKRHEHGIDLPTLSWIDMTVAVIDLNSFKPINDTHGHAAGDQVLRVVSDLLKRAFRADDIVVRWGGDEFVIYAIGARQDAILSRVLVLTRYLASRQWHVTERVTCSIGIAHGKCKTERGARRLIDRLRSVADAAMYEAKQRDVSQSCIATGDDVVITE